MPAKLFSGQDVFLLSDTVHFILGQLAFHNPFNSTQQLAIPAMVNHDEDTNCFW
jgi:hypothetical protein